MYRLLPILLFTIYFSLLAPVSFAQTSYARALSDYQFAFGQYRDAHEQYSLAKNRYLAAKTLASRQAAFEATKKMLLLRSKTLDAYFIALSVRFLDRKPQQALQNEILARLDTERNFLAQHQAEVEAQTTLQSLLEVSQEFEERQKTFEQTAYRVLATILLQEQKLRLQETEVALTAAENMIARMEVEEEDVSLLHTWVSQIRDELTKARNDQTQTQSIIDKFVAGAESQNLFAQARTTLDSSNKSLSQAVSFLRELTNLIKRT